jgi:hypothetical protein
VVDTDGHRVAAGGGAGVVTYWLIDTVPWFRSLPSEPKRYTSLALAALIPCVAWLLTLLIGYEAAPVTWQGWIERLFSLATASLIASQAIHGRMKLRGMQGV